jgi:uncharacterized protein involved in exopolysaccharide biosynthesis
MQYERPYNDEISIGDLITKLGEYRRYLFRKWWVILICAAIFGVGLRFYVKWKPEHYISHADFSVKGTEGSSTSSLSSLASSFGFGIATGAEFTNEYFLTIIQSRRMVKETLLQKREIKLGKNGTPREDYLVNFYIEMYPKWAKKKKVKNFRIDHGNIDSLTIYEDSVLTVVYDEIVDKDLTLSYNDDKDINELDFSSTNRDFSVYFASYIGRAASDFYIESQVKNETETVELIASKVDSIRDVMNAKEDQLASVTDRSAFTIKATGLVTQGRLLREIEILSTEYAEAYAQLELARFDLRNKTPLISIIDSPRISTIKEKEQVMMFMIIGFILGTILTGIVLVVRKYTRDSLEEAQKKKLLMAQESAENDLLEHKD